MFFPNLANEAIPLAGKCADQVLSLAAVADGLTSRGHTAAERGLRNDAPVPNRCNQFIIADNTLAIANEIFQDVEHLRLDSNNVGTASQLPAVSVKGMAFENVDQQLTPAPTRRIRARTGKNQANLSEKSRLSQGLRSCQSIRMDLSLRKR